MEILCDYAYLWIVWISTWITFLKKCFVKGIVYESVDNLNNFMHIHKMIMNNL